MFEILKHTHQHQLLTPEPTIEVSIGITPTVGKEQGSGYGIGRLWEEIGFSTSVQSNMSAKMTNCRDDDSAITQ
jgi:hypothetical protein